MDPVIENEHPPPHSLPTGHLNCTGSSAVPALDKPALNTCSKACQGDGRTRGETQVQLLMALEGDDEQESVVFRLCVPVVA
jgi:hypothetical protein